MGKNFTFELPVLKDGTLVTTDPYSIVRHHSYTAVAMVISGILLYHLGEGSWLGECAGRSGIAGLIFMWIYIGLNLLTVYATLQRIPKEVRLCKRNFGAQWDE